MGTKWSTSSKKYEILKKYNRTGFGRHRKNGVFWDARMPHILVKSNPVNDWTQTRWFNGEHGTDLAVIIIWCIYDKTVSIYIEKVTGVTVPKHSSHDIETCVIIESLLQMKWIIIKGLEMIRMKSLNALRRFWSWSHWRAPGEQIGASGAWKCCLSHIIALSLRERVSKSRIAGF